MCFYISSKARQRCIPLSYMNMIYKCRYSNSEARIQFKVNSNIWNHFMSNSSVTCSIMCTPIYICTQAISQDSKYRVNQPIMYKTNRHINTYRVYGSIISTNIHKPGRCTFFATTTSFFSQATTTSWPFPMCATYGPYILLSLLNEHSARLAYL